MTTKIPDGIVLIKKDRLGRISMPQERREALLAEYHRSGMSGAAFARWAGIKYPTLATWLQVERKSKEAMRTVGTEMSAPAQAQPRGFPESKSGPVHWVEAKEQPELKATEPVASRLHLRTRTAG